MAQPLAIIQARLGSTRLPGKVLMEVGGRSLVRRAWDASCAAFGRDHVVFTVPAGDTELIEHIQAFGGCVEPWDGNENDVLGRFWSVAHKYRWHPESVIVRITPDDPFKNPSHMVRVANGERLPVETGGEAFTLGQLDEWNSVEPWRDREHIGNLIPGDAPPCPPGVWTVDSIEDLVAAREQSKERDGERVWSVLERANAKARDRIAAQVLSAGTSVP